MPKLAAALTPKSLKGAIDRFEKSGAQKKRVADGGCTGLELLLKRTDDGISKRWTFRATVEGRAYDRSLYGLTYPECGIKAARDRAREYLDALRAGVDPLEEKARIQREEAEAKREAARSAYTFGNAASDWMEVARRADRWLNNSQGERKVEGYLRRSILPVVGEVPINDFQWTHVYDVMMTGDLYKEHSEDAKKCRTIINAVCTAAHTNGFREVNDEPARLIGALKAKLDLVVPHKKAKGHEPRVEPDEIPEFFSQIGDFSGMSARMLEFCILTASRPGMVQKSTHKDPLTRLPFVAAAQWKDIDLEAGTWTVSPIVMKMKGREPFTVFLSSYAVKLLRALPRFEGCPWVFTRNGVNPIGPGAMAGVIDSMNAKRRAAGLHEWIDETQSRRVGRPVNASPHGTARSSFRTWLTTDKHKNYQRFNREAAELCLAHFVGDDYGGGYNRPDLVDARRECMEAWGRYCVTGLYPDE